MERLCLTFRVEQNGNARAWYYTVCRLDERGVAQPLSRKYRQYKAAERHINRLIARGAGRWERDWAKLPMVQP